MPCIIEINPAFDPQTEDERLNSQVLDNTSKLMKAIRKKYNLVGSLETLVSSFHNNLYQKLRMEIFG